MNSPFMDDDAAAAAASHVESVRAVVVVCRCCGDGHGSKNRNFPSLWICRWKILDHSCIDRNSCHGVFFMKKLNSYLTSGDPIVCDRSIGQFPMFKNCGRGGRHPHEAVCHCPLNQRDGRTTGEGGREGGREASHAHSHGGRQPRGHCRRDGERGEGRGNGGPEILPGEFNSVRRIQ